MKLEDLSFTIKDDKGEELICDIVSIIPNDDSSEEPYVVYTDYLLDNKDEFVLHYGQVVFENNEYILKPIVDEKLINKIKENQKDELISYVNGQIQESMYD